MTELSGRRNKACYYILCLAIEAAREKLPEESKMNVICACIQQRTGKSPDAVSKALSRVTADIWDYGNRDKLREIYGRSIPERPSPKELILVLAYYCWTAERLPSDGAFLSDRTYTI